MDNRFAFALHVNVGLCSKNWCASYYLHFLLSFRK